MRVGAGQGQGGWGRWSKVASGWHREGPACWNRVGEGEDWAERGRAAEDFAFVLSKCNRGRWRQVSANLWCDPVV